jgi:CubicO group peptidase (beta-lactamase class C family)
MKKAALFILPVLILGVLGASCGGADGRRPPGLLDKSIEEISTDLTAGIPPLMEKAAIPGLQIALVRDGRVPWEGSFGVRNARTGEPVTSDTLFEAASLTKPFFAYMVMKMVDEGLIDLDRPVHTFFTRPEIETRLGHSLDAPGFRRDWLEKITARHILSHSGGLPHGEGGTPFPIFFEPGTSWKYSADGYEWLQLAIEKLKGEKLDAIMRKYVLEPLGMKRSGMVWRPAFEEVMANGHSIFGQPQDYRKRLEAFSSASLYTTAAEYARFVCAVMDGEGLEPATAREMLASVIDIKDGPGLGWSLGFGLQNDRNGKAFWQWGDYGIFRNYVIAYPERKTAVVYLTNSFNGLSICAEVVGRSLGGQALGNAFLNYRRFDSPFYTLLREAKRNGPDGVRAVLPGLRRKDPKALDWDTLGGIAGILGDEEGLQAAAIAVLEYVAGEKQNSGRAAFDLARALLIAGDREKARAYYDRAAKAGEDKVEPGKIEWDLDYLRAAEKPAVLDEEAMRRLAGDYEARQILFKDGRLFYFRKGGTAPEPRPLLALTGDTFFIQGVLIIKLKVELDAAGLPVKLVGFYEDGRRDESKRGSGDR